MNQRIFSDASTIRGRFDGGTDGPRTGIATAAFESLGHRSAVCRIPGEFDRDGVLEWRLFLNCPRDVIEGFAGQRDEGGFAAGFDRGAENPRRGAAAEAGLRRILPAYRTLYALPSALADLCEAKTIFRFWRPFSALIGVFSKTLTA